MASGNFAAKEKAAILFYSLGEELAAQVLKHLDKNLIQDLAQIMNGLRSISKEDVEEVAYQFCEFAQNAGITVLDKNGFLRAVVNRGLGQQEGEELFNEINIHRPPFDSLHNLEPKVLVNFIRSEHPQTIAIILGHLEPDIAGSVLNLLPEQMKTDVAYRIANLESVSPEIVTEIDEVLRAQITSTGAMQNTRKIGGPKQVAEMLNLVDKTTEEIIFKGLEESAPELANNIRQLMFVFEDLVKIDDRSMQVLLREVNTQELVLALKTASQQLKNNIFRNVSERAAQMIKDDLEAMGPAKLSDVEKAQQNVVKIARKLEEEGKIVIGSKGEETLV
ncbi:MAG: flagellar motor switch protein FliG [Candidatus Tectomicrobia bacterium]|uniref:Flagellar motor switch protein FliG n=1 Tax=Tectimicrobiota bacterium TaxID=2528274 RepID=A0A933LPJ5_UNCTE|nr:flagellar motor switch protein FliG [Candidatus Tectomicrobia bacterium]